MPLISVFKMADMNAGAIQTVIVEIKYISSNNVAIHTENCKMEISLDCTLKEFEKTIRQKNLKTGIAPAPFSFVCCLLCFVFVCLFFVLFCLSFFLVFLSFCFH